MTRKAQPPLAMITGSTGGIGSGVARALAEAGYRLSLVDMDRRRLDEQAASIPGSDTHVLDLMDADRVQRFVDQIASGDQVPDIAFVNAGAIAIGNVIDLPEDQMLMQLQVNLVSTMRVIRALARRMAAAGRGHIIATVSLGGIVSLKGSAAYSASKFGLRGFLWALRDELKDHGVRVSGIYPAGVDTPMLRHEARHGGSALNFVSKPVEVKDVTRAAMRVIRKPRLETYVPFSEGVTGRLAGAFPGLLARLYPLLEKRGERGRKAYLARIGPE